MDIPPDLSSKAVSLQHVGVNNVAWEKSDALKVLEYYETQEIVILGGDVLAKKDGQYHHNYDNWHFDHENRNSQLSIDYTRRYINEYPEGDYVFAMVTE